MTTLEEEVNTLRGKNSTDEWTDKDDATFQEYNDLQIIKKEAARKALVEFYLQKERLKIKAGKNKKIFQEDLEEVEELKLIVKEQQKSLDPKYALFITINPKENGLSGYKELDKKVQKCITKYWVSDYAYCYEQRSTDPEAITGLHTHILLTRGSHKPSHCEREIISTFKGLCGNLKHINIQYKRKEWVKDKLEYMLGMKTGEGKDEKVEIDEVMRNILDIPPIIHDGFTDFFSNV